MLNLVNVLRYFRSVVLLLTAALSSFLCAMTVKLKRLKELESCFPGVIV